jgi:hypothetical protein
MLKRTNNLLPATLRTKLRKIVRNHPNILSYLRIKSDVNDLPRDELIKLADNLEIDWIKELNQSESPRNIQNYNNDNWSFLADYESGAITGVYEYDLNISMLDMDVTKKVKCNYELTPEWQFFCTFDKRLKYRWGSSVLDFEIEEIKYEKVLENDFVEEKGRYWTKLDSEFLEGSLINRLYTKLEMDIWEKDQINRKENGYPPGDKSQCFLFNNS